MCRIPIYETGILEGLWLAVANYSEIRWDAGRMVLKTICVKKGDWNWVEK